MELDDLLRRFVVEGDAPSMEDLVRRTRPRLLRIARRIGAPQDAEDAVQAAYHALIRRAARSADGGDQSRPLGAPVLPWLVTAVVRIAYRHKAVAQRRPGAAALLAKWRDGESPVDRTIRSETADTLRAEVTHLPEKCRDAIVLHYLEGLPVDQVAALLDVSTSAVKMRLLRGRALLRSRLGARLAHLFLWLPWMLADVGAATWVGGGLAMKNKLAVAGVLAVAVAATLLGLRHIREEKSGGPRGARSSANSAAQTDQPAVDTTARPPQMPGASPSEAEGAFISGRVVDAQGTPVPDAEVHVTQYEEAHVASGQTMRTMPFFYPYEVEAASRTDGLGAFSVSQLVERLDSVYVVKPGYGASRVTFHEGVGRTGLRVVLKEGTRASGLVRDTQGRSLAGARVIFIVGLVTQAVHTDRAGRYLFETLPAPPWRRLASAPGYEQFRDALRGGSDQAGDFQLRRRTVIVEPVDARTGAPLAMTRGLVVRARGGELLHSIGPTWGPAVADMRYPPGRLYASNLPDLAGAGRAEFACYLFAPGFRPAVRRFALEAGSEPPHLRVELEPGAGEAVLTGRVEGARDAKIEIRHYEPGGGLRPDDRKPLLQTVEVSADGTFAVTGLPPGRFRMIVRAPGTGPEARDVLVPARELVVGLRPAARLVVLGVDSKGQPVSGAWMHVEASVESSVWEQRTGADGRAVFDDLPAGKLLVCPANFQGFTARLRGVPLSEVELHPGEHAERQVEIPQERSFVLEVVDGEERPIGGLDLTVHSLRGFGHVFRPTLGAGLAVTTDASGQARLNLYPGSYEAKFVREGVARTPRFDVAAELQHRIVVAAAPVLRGRVVDARSGEPVAQIKVALSAGPQANLTSTLTDRDGRFALAGPMSGEVTLYVWPQRGRAGQIFSDTPYPHHVQRKLDETAMRAKELLVRLPKIRGDDAEEMPVVLDVIATDAAKGAPLDGAAVGVMARRAEFWFAVGTWHTGAAGRASGRLIRAEQYRIWVSGPRGAQPPYETKELERKSGDGVIRIAASLMRKPK